MMGVIKRRILLKSNEAVNKMESITLQNQQSITDTNKEELKEPIPNNGQGIIATGTTGTMTRTSTDTKVGAGKTQWVNTIQWGKSDGVTNTPITDIQKAKDDEFNDNVRTFMVNKHSGPQMTVQPPKKEQTNFQLSGLNLQRQNCQRPQNR